MIRSVLCVVALMAGYPAFAEADDFGDRVRAYLLENPEVILEALEILAKREAQASVERRLEAFPELFADAPRHGLGDPDAPVRVIEFFDYRCVPCKAMHPRLVELVERRPEIRIEMRHLPILSPGSRTGPSGGGS